MKTVQDALGIPFLEPFKKMKPLTFPIPFTTFLREAFGGKRYAERLYLFRKYWKRSLIDVAKAAWYAPEETAEEVLIARTDAIINKLKNEGVDKLFFEPHVQRIKAWRELNRLEQRQQAARNRWDKEKRKKILELPKAAETAISQDEKCSLASKKKRKSAGSHPKK
jgi:hypothetical protein